jgi:hypothetical protein
MKYLILSILIVISCVAKSQVADKCFISKSNDKICFIDSNKVFVKVHYKHLITPSIGEGKYTIKGDILIINLKKAEPEDISSFLIINQTESIKTDILIKCQVLGEKTSCKGIEWGIKKDNVFLTFGEFDTTNKVLIEDLDTLKNANKVYIGGLSVNNVEIPIKYGTQSEYLVTLSKKVIYLSEGELSIKLHRTKEERLMLKLMNAKKLVGNTTMNFYLEK